MSEPVVLPVSDDRCVKVILPRLETYLVMLPDRRCGALETVENACQLLHWMLAEVAAEDLTLAEGTRLIFEVGELLCSGLDRDRARALADRRLDGASWKMTLRDATARLRESEAGETWKTAE